LRLGFCNHFAIGGDREHFDQWQGLHGHCHSIEIEICYLSREDRIRSIDRLALTEPNQRQAYERYEDGSLDAISLHINLSACEERAFIQLSSVPARLTFSRRIFPLKRDKGGFVLRKNT
jgi:hypothetical protein